MTGTLYVSISRICLSALLLVSMAGCKPKVSPPAHPIASEHQPAAVPKQPVTVEPEVAPISPNPESRAPGLGVVLASKLNVRATPRVAGAESVRGVLHCGDIVAIESVAGEADEWYQITLDKLAGYSHGSYIVRLGPGGKVPLCQFSFLKKKHHSPADDEKAVSDIKALIDDKEVAQHPQPGQMREQEKDTHPATAPEAGQKVTDTNVPAGHAVVTNGEGIAAKVGPSSAPGKMPDGSTAAPQPTSVAGPIEQPKPVAPAVAPAAVARVIDPGRADITLGLRATRARPVAFPHRQHQSQFACFRCHHPVSTGGGNLHKALEGDVNAVKMCHTCHAATPQAAIRPTSEDVFHTICRDCHRTAGGNRAPTGCPDCHK